MAENKEPTIFFTMEQLCEHYEISVAKFHRLRELGLPAKKIGTGYMIHREVFEQFCKNYSLSSSSMNTTKKSS